MRARSTWLFLASILLAPACTHWPDRPPIAASTQARAIVPGYADIRHWADDPAVAWAGWRRRWLADRAAAGRAGPPQVLAISSGSDKGAFAAGYLAGWSERGTRPSFDLVTGVSTGALIAPLAFLGPDQDRTLKELYTAHKASDVFRQRALSGLTGGPAFADTGPLQRLIAQLFTPDILDRIAAEHRRGRRLLIMTTNLDAERGVVWDLGAVAASGAPDRLALFRRIVLASASIPGAFPPVLIDVVADGRRLQELHVDGGTVSSLYALPPAVLWGDAPTALRSGSGITLLYNGRLEPRYKVVQPRAFAIVSRALETVIGASDRATIELYRQFADRNGIALSVAAIGDDFAQEPRRMFDPAYTGPLWAYGRGRGLTRER